MKKALALLLAAVLAFGLVGCGSTSTDTESSEVQAGDQTDSGKDTTTVTAADGSEVVTVVTTGEGKEITDLVQASSWGVRTWCIFNNNNKPGIYINFIDPLVTADEYNNPTPCLAESWSPNADETVWTFNLRQGVQWVDYEGNVKGEVTSEDWLYGLEWVLNFWKNDSYQTTLPMSIISGAKEYYEYTQSLPEEEAWALGVDKMQEMVGIETPDDYTIVYTCINPCAYFDSLATSVFLYPLAKGQLDEVGVKNYKSINPYQLWCCGPYVIESYTDDNYWTIVPNESYWDESCEVFDSVTIIKVESTDVSWELFQSGDLNYPIDLSTSTINMISADPTNPWHDYLAKKADTGVSWGLFFNYAKNNLDGTVDTAWNTAVANENFRQCFYYGLDLYNFLALIDPVDPESAARGTMTVYGLSTLSDGTDYTSLVYDMIDYHPFEDYSRQDLDKLANYKAAAMEELSAQGISFPIHMDMWSASTQSDVDKFTILKEIFEDYLGTDFVEIDLHTYITNKTSEVYNTSYFSIELQGYGALFSDPLTFLNQMCSDMNGNGEWADLYGHISDCTNGEVVALFDEFTSMVRTADAISGDHDARYQALAETEAFALQHALCIPTHTPATREITPINTYSKIAAINDSQSTRYVNWETNSDYFTAEEIELLRNAYLAVGGVSAYGD